MVSNNDKRQNGKKDITYIFVDLMKMTENG